MLRARPFAVAVHAVVSVLFDQNLDQKFDPNLDQTLDQNIDQAPRPNLVKTDHSRAGISPGGLKQNSIFP